MPISHSKTDCPGTTSNEAPTGIVLVNCTISTKTKKTHQLPIVGLPDCALSLRCNCQSVNLGFAIIQQAPTFRRRTITTTYHNASVDTVSMFQRRGGRTPHRKNTRILAERGTYVRMARPSYEFRHSRMPIHFDPHDDRAYAMRSSINRHRRRV